MTTVTISTQILSSNMGDYADLRAATESCAIALRERLREAARSRLDPDVDVIAHVDVRHDLTGDAAPSTATYHGEAPRGLEELQRSLEHIECVIYEEWAEEYQG